MSLVPVFAARSDLNRNCSGCATIATRTSCSTDLHADLGGVESTPSLLGTNHTHGDTVVFVDGVLFSGRRRHEAAALVRESHGARSALAGQPRRLEAMKPK
jgi:hypothetical protein